MIKSLAIQEHDNSVLSAENIKYNATERHGKSTLFIQCPFCNKQTEAYKWSLAGSGKKCSHCKDVLHTGGLSYKRMKSVDEAKVFYDNNLRNSDG